VSRKARSVLFLCTGNSARSIMAEVMLNQAGAGRFKAYSAGSQPAGRVSPLAMETLESLGFRTAEVRSKSWDEFAAPDAPRIDFIITVCANAAGEACPVWPGHPVTAHWGVDDPAAVQGDEGRKRAAFRETADILRRRIERLVGIPASRLDAKSATTTLREIGAA